MKNWEVIKAIAENPKLTFKNLRFGGVLGYLGDGTLGWIGGTNNIGKDFTIHYRPDEEEHRGNWDDDWEIAREPVDFMSAANSGHKITPESCSKVGFQDLTFWTMTVERVNGKWLIE